LPFILFQWKDLAGEDGAQVKAWTADQLKTDEGASKLARAFTGESWSHSMGMFSLGDRVATRKTRALIDGLERIMDIGEFRRRLEEIESRSSLEGDPKQSVQTFLEAWRRKEARGDRYS
jgi:hypothetical protein